MRIAYLTTEFITEPNFSGGLSNYLGRITPFLANLGHDVHVIVFTENPSEIFEFNGVTIHRISVMDSQYQRFLKLVQKTFPTLAFCHVLHIAMNWRAYQVVRKIHKERPFDIIQVPHMGGYGIFLALRLLSPITMRASGYQPALDRCSEVSEISPFDHSEYAFTSTQFGLIDHIFAPSQLVRDLLIREEKLPHVEVIRTPFFDEKVEWDYGSFETHLSGKTYALFFGGLQIYKGVLEIVDALPEIFDEAPDFTMVFVGSDHKTAVGDSMEHYIRSALPSYQDRIVILDALPHAQLFPIIDGAKLVLMPSRIDNMPNTLLEAMSLGKPVIGTIGASLDEFITDGENGFLVPINDSRALATKVIESWNRRDLDRIGQAAKMKIEEFAPEKTVEELLSYYRRVIADYQSKSSLKRKWSKFIQLIK